MGPQLTRRTCAMIWVRKHVLSSTTDLEPLRVDARNVDTFTNSRRVPAAWTSKAGENRSAFQIDVRDAIDWLFVKPRQENLAWQIDHYIDPRGRHLGFAVFARRNTTANAIIKAFRDHYRQRVNLEMALDDDQMEDYSYIPCDLTIDEGLTTGIFSYLFDRVGTWHIKEARIGAREAPRKVTFRAKYVVFGPIAFFNHSDDAPLGFTKPHTPVPSHHLSAFQGTVKLRLATDDGEDEAIRRGAQIYLRYADDIRM